VTTPLAGDYYIEHGCYAYAVDYAAEAFMSYAVGATAAAAQDAVLVIEPNAARTGYASISRKKRKNAIPSAAEITAKYRGDGVTGAGFGYRWLSIKPIRLG